MARQKTWPPVSRRAFDPIWESLKTEPTGLRTKRAFLRRAVLLTILPQISTVVRPARNWSGDDFISGDVPGNTLLLTKFVPSVHCAANAPVVQLDGACNGMSLKPRSQQAGKWRAAWPRSEIGDAGNI